MVTEITKGEKKLIEYELTDSDGNSILFLNLLEVIVELIDYTGNKVTKNKTNGDIIEGSTTSSIKFEISDTDLDNLDIGLINSRTTITTEDTDFSSDNAIQINNDELLLANG